MSPSGSGLFPGIFGLVSLWFGGQTPQYSELIPGSARNYPLAQGTIFPYPGDQTQAGSLQGKHTTHCPISLAFGLFFLS